MKPWSRFSLQSSLLKTIKNYNYYFEIKEQVWVYTWWEEFPKWCSHVPSRESSLSVFCAGTWRMGEEPAHRYSKTMRMWQQFGSLDWFLFPSHTFIITLKPYSPEPCRWPLSVCLCRGCWGLEGHGGGWYLSRWLTGTRLIWLPKCLMHKVACFPYIRECFLQTAWLGLGLGPRIGSQSTVLLLLFAGSVLLLLLAGFSQAPARVCGMTQASGWGVCQGTKGGLGAICGCPRGYP